MKTDQRKRIEELEAALRPFCDAYGDMPAEIDDEMRIYITSPEVALELTARDFRLAAKMLRPDWYPEGGDA